MADEGGLVNISAVVDSGAEANALAKSVNTIPPIQQNPMQNGYDENKSYGITAMRTKCQINYSIITNKLERHAQQAAHNAQQVHH